MDGSVVALTVIAAYDVSKDSRRARLAALLQSCGDRIQYSVFLLTIADDELAELRDRALAIIDPDTDSVYLMRQCADCWSRVECIGQSLPPTQELFWMAL